MIPFIPPPSLELPEDYRLYVPRATRSKGSEAVLARICDAIAELYDLAADEIPALAASGSAVLAIQLRSRDYQSGSVPFLRFESVVDRLKKTLLHTAAFVVTDAPTVENIPEEAHQYLAHCRFLQTEVGSYVARVQLPDNEPLLERTLFDEAVLSREVNETLRGALAFVVGPVFRAEQTIFAAETFEQQRQFMNVDVFRDVGELLEKSGAEEVKFSFEAAEGEQVITTGRMSGEQFERLKTYIEYARERLAADQEIDVVGRIFELRSRRPDRSRNHVGIAAILDGREVQISLTMRREDYHLAVMAHNRNRRVRIRAAVRRMRTQLRVVRLEYFEELPE